MADATQRAYLTGDTKAFRGILKEKGWKYNDGQPGRSESWYKDGEWWGEEHVIITVRDYSGIRNRGKFEAELADVPAAPAQPKLQSKSRPVTFSEFMDGENDWE